MTSRFHWGTLAGLLWVAATGANLLGQTGNLAGTVVESSRKTLLAGAEVSIAGASISASTDESGRYQLLGIRAGKAKLVVRYLGLETFEREVEVKAGTTLAMEVELTLDRKDSVVVTGASNLEGQARALNEQKNSINLVNLVAADQIGSFPDPNAAEATQRIPGIVVQRDQGEGRFVLIRGTEPRLSATLIDGERIGTTENTSRQIPLDTIPADVLGAIEVTKVLTPDQEADSIGGRVNLITKRAPLTRHWSTTLGSGFNTLVNRDLKDYNASYGQTVLRKKLGFNIAGTFYENNRGSQDIEPGYGSNFSLSQLDLRDYRLTRTRQGIVADVSYKLNAGSELFLRGLRSEYEDSEFRYRYRLIPSSGRLERGLRDRYHDSTQLALSTGGTHTLPGTWLMAWRVGYSRADLRTPNRLEATFRQSGVTFQPNATATSIDPRNIQANPQNENPSAYTFVQNAIQNDRGAERNWSGSVDFSHPTRQGVTGMLKFGLRVRDANRIRNVNTLTQAPQRGVTLNLAGYADATYAPANNYLGGKYASFGKLFPDSDQLRQLNRGGSLVTTAGATGDSGSYTAGERVIGGYVQEEIYLSDRTTLLPGVRIEAADVKYGAPNYILNTNGTVRNRTIVNGGTDYINVLPGLHFRHLLTPNTVVRASFSRGLARPNYSDLAPFVLQDPSALTISRGNPDLKVTKANNVDVSVEHYFSSVGIVSAGFFYKNLSDYVFATTATQQIGADQYRVSQRSNGDTANVRGLELSLVRRMDFLPGVLKGTSVYTNYTYVDSSATIPGRGGFILPGQASHMGNASLGYDYQGWSTRLSFNFQGTYLLGVGADRTADTWLDNRLQIDFSASKSFRRHYRVFIDLLNLANEPYRVYQAVPNRPIQEERYKVWAVTGLKMQF